MQTPIDPAEIELLLDYCSRRGRGADARSRAAFDRGVDAGWGLACVGISGLTALGTACKRAQPSLASRLLRAGADPNLAGTEGSAPIALAAANGSTDCAFLLLDHGALPDGRDAAGAPALHLAAATGNHALAARLVRAGADLDGRDAEGANALMAAASHSKQKVAGAKQKVARALINARSPLNSVDSEGRTALMRAADALVPGVFLDLLRAGADPLPLGLDGLDARALLDAHSNSPLHPGLSRSLREAVVAAEALALSEHVPLPAARARRPFL